MYAAKIFKGLRKNYKVYETLCHNIQDENSKIRKGTGHERTLWVIWPPTSSVATKMILVENKPSEHWLSIDYRQWNGMVLKNSLPVAMADDVSEKLRSP